MQSKNSFFNPTKKLRQDRFLPQKAIDKNFREFQRAKIDGSFSNSKDTPYNNQLLGVLWNINYPQTQTLPVLGQDLPSAPAKRFYKPISTYSLDMDRVLDGPDLANDFYQSPLCWGNVLYVALYDAVYSYNCEQSQVKKLEAGSVHELSIRALAYNNNVLAKAAFNNSVCLIDPTIDTKLQEIMGLSTYSMVGDNQHGFYLTSKDTNHISYLDIRSKQVTSTYSVLDTTTIGLALHENSSSLAVSSFSGIRLFDVRRMGQEKFKFSQHQGSVKALAFSPDGSNIISGGGVSDKSLKLWSARTGQLINETYLGNQICGVHWLDKNGVFINGGATENRVSCWDVTGIKLVMVAQSTQDKAHTDRVLYAAQNPKKREQIVTASGGDESLRFWSVNNIKKEEVEKSQESKLLLYRQIR